MRNEEEYRRRPRNEILGFMTGLSMRAKNMRAAEGYMLELLACVAFNHKMDGKEN